jgi:hypothetical protein
MCDLHEAIKQIANKANAMNFIGNWFNEVVVFAYSFEST